MDIKEKIKKIDLFSSLSAKQFEQLAEISEIVKFPEGEKLFRVGEEAQNIYIMMEGKVSIQVSLSSRPEMVSIVILSKFGQLIGWSGLMGPSYYTADAICVEDSQFLKIKGKELFEILVADKEAGFDVLKGIVSIVSERLRNIQRVVLKTM
ncbi:MAG: cyclic nucleotide-binding domain-containing protein [Chloroflexota bacterium]